MMSILTDMIDIIIIGNNIIKYIKNIFIFYLIYLNIFNFFIILLFYYFLIVQRIDNELTHLI